MKPASLFLAASLAANLALAAVVLRHPAATAADSPSPTQALPAAGAVNAPAGSQVAAAAALANAAKTGDPAGVRDQLRALGVSDDVVRSVVRALVGKRILDIQKSITSAQASAGYWRNPANGFFNYSSLTKEQRAQLREASRASTKQMEELMGPDPMDPTATRFSFLPPEKAAKARELERDYSDLRQQMMAETEGFHVPADEEKVAFLEKEQRKDLAALLSPEELEAFDLRNSSTANRVRSQFREFDLSETEYKELYAAQKAFDEKLSGRVSSNDPSAARDQAQARTQAQQALNAEMKATLGDDRYTAYLRSQNGDYRTLEAAAKRYNLPQTAVDQVFSARDQTVASAQRIASDANLNPDQRNQALAALAEQTRSQVRTSLGAEIGDSYLKSNMRWLDSLQRGQTLTVTPDGSVYARPAPRTAPPTSGGVSNPALPGPVSPRS